MFITLRLVWSRVTSIALDSKMLENRDTRIRSFWEVCIYHCPKENSFFIFFFVLEPLFCFFSDMIISNKVVVYDMEKQAISWTEHNCKFQLVQILSIKCGSEGLSPLGRMHGGL